MPKLFRSASVIKRRHLAACLAASLAAVYSVAGASQAATRASAVGTHGSAELSDDLFSYLALGRHLDRKTTGLLRSVTTCADNANDPNSLRAQIAAAASGDIIDLTPLAMVCSKITLGSEIAVPQDSLYIQGPGVDQLVIDANGTSRIFDHTGAATLGVYDLTLSNGYYASGNPISSGGCISSAGSVVLMRSLVSDCRVSALTPNTLARGGAVFTTGNLLLGAATLTANEAYAGDSGTRGGAAYVLGNLVAKYAEVSSNSAHDATSYHRSGAGAFVVFGDSTVRGSTISNNYSEYDGAIFFQSPGKHVLITNSTVTGNSSGFWASAITNYSNLDLTNATIAFNKSLSPVASLSAVFTTGDINLVSSILSGNAAAGVPADLAGGGSFTYTGTSNVIVASQIEPANTIHDCPKLQPLANNGGLTLTHALKQDSPAIDSGTNPRSWSQDQRASSRTAGVQTDIGAVERQLGEIDEQLLVSGFDGLCDQ